MIEIEPPNYLLSVTSATSGDTVTIHADKEGLLALRARLDILLDKLDRGGAQIMNTSDRLSGQVLS